MPRSTCLWSLVLTLLLLTFGATGSSGQSGGGQSAKSAATEPDATPEWQTAMGKRADELVKLNGSGTDVALRDRLMKMLAADQAARTEEAAKAVAAGGGAARDEMSATDARLTSELKDIVRTKGWPTIALVGVQASGAAMTILTHTPDHAWMQTMLPELQRLGDNSKIEGSGLATLVDKELVEAGKLQKYGTQFKFVDGEMAMYAVDDPVGLDTRRARVLLPPLGVYKDMLAQAYKIKVRDGTVPAGPPEVKKP
jgi:hypothetical protein